MTDTLKLRELIKESGLKYNYIAKKLGLTHYGLQKKIENKTQFRTTEVKILCELLKINSLKKKEEIFFANEVDFKSTSEKGET